MTIKPSIVDGGADAAPPSPPTPLPPGVRGEALALPFNRSDKSHRVGERRNRGFAKAMRGNPTEVERQLWLILKDRRFADFKFRRQVPMGRYIADFVCHARMLIIELDGSQHGESTGDAARDAWFAGKGFAVLRIWNNDLIGSSGAVADAIWDRLENTAPKTRGHAR